MDPLWLAMSKLRRGKLDECIKVCDEILSSNAGDQAAWTVKCKALIKQNYIDDIEADEEGVAEVMMDENAVAAVPRPGTSLQTPQVNSRGSGSYDQAVRPVSQSGRPVTGFARPSSSRPTTQSSDLRNALQSSRGSTSGGRPMTSLGRELRLGTASLLSHSAGMVDVEKLNVKKYAKQPGLAMVLADYLLYVEHNTRAALDLCAEATKEHEFKSWWWKARLGKCYFKLGLLREAEQQFRSALKLQPTVNTYLELCNVYVRLDLPNTALEVLSEACDKFTCEPRLPLGLARLHDQLNDQDSAMTLYKRVLALDASNVESIACLGAHCFYADQPEMAIRYYRRLLQMGVHSTEVWNNIGLCCFYSSQYDMALGCFDRALAMASDEDMADIWYNIGHVGVSLGDLGLAYQAFKVAVSVNNAHGEALNNIAVLEMRRQKYDVAKACLGTACDVAPQVFEPFYNSALLAYRTGDFQEAHSCVSKALQIYPNHIDSKELLNTLQKTFLYN